MGILKTPAKFVQKLKLPAGFSVCELGDQYLTCVSPHRIAAQWYREMGCGRYVALDGNGRGTITCDLNHPIEGLGPFDLVTDFGTGEHVFDQAQVWRTLHGLMKVGGYLAFDRPTQGYPTHCYYLADECLFTDVAAANEYEVIRFGREKTKRGELVRGVFRKMLDAPFKVPQQRRYHSSLRIPL
ncbi:MAG: class I SAM-dependent methyltransferase [Betaproteobacteria bacterium]|nr:class I SAM-dependent methyltransferase [Betaproteobacteria bacterium]